MIASIVSTTAIFLVLERPTSRGDNLIYNRFLALGTHAPDPRILLVAIDSQSLQQVGPWPWPHAVHAKLIDRLAEARPRVIDYDVLFLEPAKDDAPLGAAIRRAGNVFVPLLLDSPGSNGARFNAIYPVGAVRTAAAGMGHVDLSMDPDGVVRRTPLVEHDGARQWPHLVERIMAFLQGKSGPLPEGPALIPFAGPAGTYPIIPASALLRGEIPPSFLRDRIVIVGATAQGLGDEHPIPLGRDSDVMSGIEIHANLLDGLLHGSIVTEVGLPWRLIAALAPTWMLLLAVRRFWPRVTMYVLLGLIVFLLSLTAGLFVFAHLWLPPIASLLPLILLYPLWAWRRLTGVSNYLIDELELLRSEPNLLRPLGSQPAATDPVMREKILLSDAIAELRAVRLFVAQSLDQLPDAIFVLDESGTVTLSNQLAESLAASGPRPAPCNSVTDFLERLDLRPLIDFRPLWPPSRNGDRREARAADGRIFEILFGERHNSYGRHVGWIVRLTDVSVMRIAERQRDTMLQFLTHDMRTPQSSILALTTQTDSAEIDADLARRISQYARRTLDLADGIVHLARAESMNYEPELLNLPDLMSDAIDELWPQIRARRLNVETIGTDLQILVAGDRSLLTRALINLIDNAIKYGREEGRLTCIVRIEKGEGADLAVCEIGDNGEGIASDRLAKLFSPFQLGNSFVKSAHGAGLGLSFVATVVARHGGHIACRSILGLGSTFTLSFPLALEVANEPAAQPGSLQATVAMLARPTRAPTGDV